MWKVRDGWREGEEKMKRREKDGAVCGLNRKDFLT